MTKALATVLVMLMEVVKSTGQCPDRIFIQGRLNQILKEAQVSQPDHEKIESNRQELAGYLPAFQKCPIRGDTVLANLYQRIGALCYRNLNFEQAVTWSQKAIHFAREEQPARPEFLIRVYHFLQIYYDSLHLTRQQMVAADSCVQIAVRADKINNVVLFDLYLRVSYAYYVGDYQRCLEYAQLGEAITRFCTDSHDSLVYLSNFVTQHINALIIQKRFDEASAILRLRIAEDQKTNASKACDAFYAQLAQIAKESGDNRLAIALMHQSLSSSLAAGKPLGIKQTYNDIGELYRGPLNNPAKAISYFIKALSFHSHNPTEHELDVIESVNIYGNIGSAFAAMSQFERAHDFFQKAFDLIRPGIDEKDFLHLPLDVFTGYKNLQYVTDLIRSKADALVLQSRFTGQQQYLISAIQVYKIADQVLMRIRTAQMDNVSGMAWRRNARNLYEHAIEACFEDHNVQEGFYFFEKSRAALLNDEINSRRRSTDEDIRKQQQLQQQISLVRTRRDAQPPSSPQYASLEKDLYTLTQQKDQIMQAIKRRDPLYFKSFIDSVFICVNDVKKKIVGGRQSLLEIFEGDSAVYTLYLSSTAGSLSKINKHDYDTLTRSFNNYLSDPLAMNQHFNAFTEAAGQLYTLLFAGIPAFSDLIISPDGQYFPFEALIDNTRHDRSRFLLYEHAISYTYSAEYLLEDSASNVESEDKLFMGLAPVRFASNNLPTLPRSDESLQHIASHFIGNEQFVGEVATRARFLNDFARYNIIQLYTHASGGTESEEPRIYFADSSLGLSDIDPAYRPATKLVVLSACETGKGVVYKGEGVFSFNRGFAAIGIPSSVVNLWSVDNEAIYSLTELFYKHLAKGLPLDIALQRAKIDYIGGTSGGQAMPCYWASTVVIGNTGKLVTAHARWPWWWDVLIVVAILGIVTVFKIKR